MKIAAFHWFFAPSLSYTGCDPHSLNNTVMGWGQASAFRLTEVVGLAWGQSRRNAEGASGACCPFPTTMPTPPGQQAQAREAYTEGHKVIDMIDTSKIYQQRRKVLMKRDESGRLEISLHAWPSYGMVNLDIFSCEPFDEKAVIRFAMEYFQTMDVEVHTVERAQRSPRPVSMHVASMGAGVTTMSHYD